MISVFSTTGPSDTEATSQCVLEMSYVKLGSWHLKLETQAFMSRSPCQTVNEAVEVLYDNANDIQHMNILPVMS